MHLVRVHGNEEVREAFPERLRRALLCRPPAEDPAGKWE